VTSGAKVVILMFASVLAIAALVVVAFLLTKEPAVRCVEGEMQDNAVRADGSVLPRVETFSTLGAAEAFICRRIPHPRATGDLMLREVRVARELSLGKTIEGEGGASIEIEYASGRAAASLRLAVKFPEVPLPEATAAEERVRIQGREGFLFSRDGLTLAQWNKGGFTFAAEARLDAAFTLEDALAALETVR